jgi:hypothetical protein
MPQFWVPAVKALSLVTRETGGEYAAILAICSRAHAGLLKSKADLLIAGDKRAEQVPVPSDFWWAEGHEALEQDWATGDFSTWIEQRIHLRAFGVRFDFDGLRMLLPAEAAATALRELSVSGDPAWLSAREARRFMYDQVGVNPAKAGMHLIDQCRLGFVPARAQLMQKSDTGQPDRWTLEEREWDVPSWFWSNFTAQDASSQDWDRGLLNGKGRAPEGRCWIRLSGVHFLRNALEGLLPDKEPVVDDAISANRGGRPRKEWWDDLWCAVWGRVYRGDLVPKSQADLERAMLEWVEARGQSVAESTVKPLARKMFLEMQCEDEN